MFHKIVVVFVLIGALFWLALQATAQESRVPVHGGGWPI